MVGFDDSGGEVFDRRNCERDGVVVVFAVDEGFESEKSTIDNSLSKTATICGFI